MHVRMLRIPITGLKSPKHYFWQLLCIQNEEDILIMDSRRKKNRNLDYKHREKGHCPAFEASGNSMQHGTKIVERSGSMKKSVISNNFLQFKSYSVETISKMNSLTLPWIMKLLMLKFYFRVKYLLNKQMICEKLIFTFPESGVFPNISNPSPSKFPKISVFHNLEIQY